MKPEMVKMLRKKTQLRKVAQKKWEVFVENFHIGNIFQKEEGFIGHSLLLEGLTEKEKEEFSLLIEKIFHKTEHLDYQCSLGSRNSHICMNETLAKQWVAFQAYLSDSSLFDD